MDRDLGAIVDIVLAARDLAELLRGVTKEEFLRQKFILAAAVRQLEIVGEATKRLTPEFRERHPSIPWRDMAGMRDRLIHAYDDLDLDRVWEAATERLPEVSAYLEPLLPSDP